MTSTEAKTGSSGVVLDRRPMEGSLSNARLGVKQGYQAIAWTIRENVGGPSLTRLDKSKDSHQVVYSPLFPLT